MSRLSTNILANVLGQALLLVLSFVAVRYVFAQLGEDVLGMVYFTMMLSAVLSAVLDLGVSATVIRQIPAHATGRPDELCGLLRTASLMSWTAYLLLAAALYAAAPVLATSWLNLKTLDIPSAVWIIRVLGLTSLLLLPRALYGGILRGLQRMVLTNLLDVGAMAAQQLGIVLILVLGGGLAAVVWWIAGSWVLGLGAYLLAAARAVPAGALLPGYSSEAVRKHRRYAWHMAAISLLAVVHIQADKVLVSKFLPIGLVGYYGVASALVAKMSLVTGAMAQAALPAFSALVHSGDREGLMAHYRRMQELLCIGTLPVLAAIPFAACPLFTAVLNAEAAALLVVPVTLLCVGTYLNGTLNMPYVVSLAVGKPEITTRLNLLALVVVLPVTASLIWRFGLVGAGLSWVVYHLFAYGYAVPRMAAQCLKMPASAWYRHVLRVGGLGGLTFGAAGAVVYAVDPYAIPLITASYTGALVVFLLGALWLRRQETHGRAFS